MAKSGNGIDQFATFSGWKLVLCISLVLLVLLARVPSFWSSGEFVAEDGWVFFADAWNHPFATSVMLPYAGYFHLLPRLLAGLCSGLPLVWQPYAYAALGLGLNAVILSAFYLPVFRHVLASDLGRLIVVAFLAVAPNAQNLGLLLGLHWYLAFGLCLVLITPAPASVAGKIAFGAITILCVWSSPSTLVLAPLAVFAWWRSRHPADHLKFSVLCGALFLAAVSVLLLRLNHPERTGAFRWGDVLVSIDRLVLRGWIGTGLLGPQLAGFLAGRQPLVLDALALGVVVALTAWLWKNRQREYVRPAALVLGAGLLMLLLSLTRTAYVAEMPRLAMPLHTRYLTAPTLLLYTGLGIVAGAAWPGGWRRLLAPLLGLAAGLLVWSWPGQVHWSRPAVRFHLRDAIPAIEHLKAQFARDGKPASLFIPSDVPYWGPVLEVGGGLTIPPEAGLAKAIGAKSDATGHFNSWLGRFTEAGQRNWIEHNTWGRLEFTGVERGRVFFRDQAGRLLFTSPLLYPRAWMLDGFQWTIIEPTLRK